MPKVFRIRNWDMHFENHESRKLRSLTWVPVPNKHDGRGYRRVCALRNSVQVFCGWSLIYQVASKMPTRGVLHDDDGALTASDLSAKTGYPESVFEAAFQALVTPGIGWLEEIEWPPPEQPESGESPGISRCPPLEGKGREQKGTEGQGTEGKAKLSSSEKKLSKLSLAAAEAAVAGHWKGQLLRILESDPDFQESNIRADWALFFQKETDDFAKLLVKKFEENKDEIERPGAYLSAVAMKKGRWVK